MFTARKKYIIWFLSLTLLEILFGIMLGIYWAKEHDFTSMFSIIVYCLIGLVGAGMGVVYFLGITSGSVICKGLMILDNHRVKIVGMNGRIYSYSIRYFRRENETILLSPNKRLWFSFDMSKADTKTKECIERIILESKEDSKYV